MRQQSSFSRHFDKIGNSFATRLHCSNCEAERLMMIRAIEPASHRGRDEVLYQCTDCGADRTEIAMVYRASVGPLRGNNQFVSESHMRSVLCRKGNAAQ